MVKNSCPLSRLLRFVASLELKNSDKIEEVQQDFEME